MDKTERAKVLRLRFKAKGGIAYVATGKPRHEPRGWMHKPDPKPKPTPRIKRNAGGSVLTRIAKKAKPVRLVKRYRNAEHFLASRARR